MENKIKKYFLAFNVLINILFFLSLIFIAIYISIVNNYNSRLKEIWPHHIYLKKMKNWKYMYIISFILIYLSFFIIWITQLTILLRNKNSLAKSLFAIFYWKQLILIADTSKKNKTNFIIASISLFICLLSIIISSVFNLISDFIHLPYIIYSIYLITIFLIYIPLCITIKKINSEKEVN